MPTEQIFVMGLWRDSFEAQTDRMSAADAQSVLLNKVCEPYKRKWGRVARPLKPPGFTHPRMSHLCDPILIRWLCQE